jgi:ATP-binding cassette, subfamily G (WHITE), member 2, PDR
MSSEKEKPAEYLPIRTGPSNTDPNDNDRVEVMASSDASTNAEEKGDEMRRVSTSRSVRERTFEPIAAGDREQLQGIASNLTGEGIVRTSTVASALERRDTLYGVDIGDPVLDPRSPRFDPYKWSKMYVQFPITI